MSVALTICSVEQKVGKTIFAINLGVSLIQETQKSVILVDLSTDGDGILASSLLKLSSLNTLSRLEVTTGLIKQHVQQHSSQLFLLTIDSVLVRGESRTREFVTTLFKTLREMFDYIIVDTSSQSNRITYETIDVSDTIIFVSTSIDQESPVGIIGNQDFRHVVTVSDSVTGHSTSHNQAYFLLPRDSFTVNTFRKSGIPFVIQAPYRPISKAISRFARDIGEKLVGLALTGGAALGLTQLGILEVFERNRIAIDMMTGSSFGAFIGAVYASGIELRRFTRYIVSWASAQNSFLSMNFYPFRGRFLRQKRLQLLCDTFLKDVYFEELLIPLNVIAFNIRTGKDVIFREGKVLDAIEASMRIPGVFVPFKHTEKYLIDSSVIYPTPVVPLKRMGAHITITVHVSSSSKDVQRYCSQNQNGRFPSKQQAIDSDSSIEPEKTNTAGTFPGPKRTKPDIVITPNIGKISCREFHKVNECIDAGARAAEDILSKIEELKWGEGS